MGAPAIRQRSVNDQAQSRNGSIQNSRKLKAFLLAFAPLSLQCGTAWFGGIGLVPTPFRKPERAKQTEHDLIEETMKHTHTQKPC